MNRENKKLKESWKRLSKDTQLTPELKSIWENMTLKKWRIILKSSLKNSFLIEGIKL